MENTTDKTIDYRQAQEEISRLRAENENLKAKLENRDLNLSHLRSIIEEIESALN